MNLCNVGAESQNGSPPATGCFGVRKRSGNVLQQGISRGPGSVPALPAVGLDVDQVLEHLLLGEGLGNPPGTLCARCVAHAFSQQPALQNLVHI